MWRRAREAGAEEERMVVDVADKLETPRITSEREVGTEAGDPSDLRLSTRLDNCCDGGATGCTLPDNRSIHVWSQMETFGSDRQ